MAGVLKEGFLNAIIGAFFAWMKRIVQSMRSEEYSEDNRSVSAQLPPITVIQRVEKNLGKVIGAVINLPDPDAERMSEWRKKLIDQVRSQWIEIEGAARPQQPPLQAIETDHNAFVHGTGLLHLPRQFLTDTVHSFSPAQDVIAHLNPTGSDDTNFIPAERSIYEVFQKEGRKAMLILGAPGVGKTVTMLELARDALQKANRDEDQPVPVILDLASWARDQRSISDWVAQELNTIQYGIPKEISHKWLKQNDLLLLLDGLNEVTDSLRRPCVERINEFVTSDKLAGLVVCCRTEEYRNLPVLSLRNAIVVETLTDSQLYAYFERAGTNLAGLYDALQKDPLLHALAEAPLMLHIMSTAYADVESAEISGSLPMSIDALRRHLVNVYTKRMFLYGGDGNNPFSDFQITGWLSWLARQMEMHRRPVFLIEHLQPSWLSSTVLQWVYMAVSRANVGLVTGLVGGIAIGMALAPSEGIAQAFQRGVTEGVVGGGIAGLFVGLIDMFWIERLRHNRRLQKLPELSQTSIKVGLTMIVVGTTVATVFGLVFGSLHFLGDGIIIWFKEGALVGMLAGLSASLIFSFGPHSIRSSLWKDIQTVERVGWSRVRARRGGILATSAGILAGALSGVVSQGTPLVSPLVERGLSTALIVLIMTLVGGTVFFIIGVVFGGFAGTFRKVEKATPNEGFRLSLINAGWVALVVGAVLAAVTVSLGFIIGGGESDTIVAYLFYGLFFSVLASIWYGGLFVLQHTVLRLLLWVSGYTPVIGQYAKMLDYAAQRIFLYKRGGGYMFVNRYVQDYFAGLDKPDQT